MFEVIDRSPHQPYPKICISQARIISHKLNALDKVVLERYTCTIQSIQVSNDYHHIPFIRSTWCFDVSVHDFISLDAHAVQIRHNLSNTHSITRNDTCVVILGGTSVMWPPSTILTLCLRSSILTSKIIWHFMNWCPGGGVSPFPMIPKSTRTERISLAMASDHSVFPLVLLSAMDYLAVFGHSIPNFIVILTYFFTPQYFTLEIILSRLCSTCFDHQLKIGSWSILCYTYYSATSTG